MNYEEMTKAELINELESIKSKLEVADVSGKATDTTGRKHVDSELISRIRQQEIVVHLGHKALHDGDIISLMNEAVKAIADILDNKYCKILELMPDGKTFLLRAGVGWKKGLVGHATVPAEPLSQAGYTLQSRKPVIVDDMKTETRFSCPLLLHEHNVVSGMSVVIQGQKDPWGLLGTHTTRHTSYSKNDINFLQAVANILAGAIARREAEDTLKESEEKYHKLVESANDAIFVADAETGIIIDVNKRAEQMIGLPAEKIIGIHQTLLHPPEETEFYKRVFEDHIQSGKAIIKGLIVCNKGGGRIPVEISASITELKGRKIIQGIFRDMTEHVQAEEELKKYKILFDNITDLAYICDTKGNVLYVNKVFQKLSGHKPEEFIGKSFAPLFDGENLKKAMELYTRTLKGETPRQEVYFKDTGILCEYKNLPLRDKNGNIIGVIGIARDITERRKADEKLREQTKALEQKNIALSEILGQIELEKKQIKDNVIANAENLLLPVIQKLRLKGESRKYVQLLLNNLQELTSSFGTKLTLKESKLTSREIEVCNMIKNGLASKEIASLLNISLRTAEKHRINIRRKLGIIKKDINLASFLKTF